jgi:hypothetical protein
MGKLKKIKNEKLFIAIPLDAHILEFVFQFLR